MSRRRRRLIRGIGYGVLLAAAAFVLVQLWFLGHVWYWVDHNPQSTAFMQARLEVMRQDDPRARLTHRWVSYRRISPHLKRAVVAAEDARFMSHGGFDWEEIRNAFERNVREGEIVRGGSTITQQLAKNLFLSGERAWWRKAQEALITLMLESLMTKRRILEIYLNVIEWGDGIFGAEAAARQHFGESAASLDPEQAARLAAMVPSPRLYLPGSYTPYISQRTATILARMNGVRIP
ncbi:MAG TPA: monofunctional biosynthetic peptidoglycan transglycosylase [Burkholderiales bacterium]|nr:monofunctional biosynthetic peptidoglycan transglycosylase [Burkholderiales bacterium]